MPHQPRTDAIRVAADPAAAGERLDRFLARRVEGLSRSRLKNLIEDGRVACGGATITDPSHRVKPGQDFTIVVPEAEPAIPEAQSIALDIVYEDADMIVVDKPAGMVVHPAPGNPDATLVNALIAHCGASLSGIGGVRRPGIVHRLDKDTSGLIVAAKNDAAHAALSAAFAERTAERAYLALVWGVPHPLAGAVEGRIGRSRSDRKRMAVLKAGGRTALTRYRVVENYGTQASMVECRLATGRTHQIRVHMASIGHPVIGDPVYGRAGRARMEGLAPDVADAIKALRRQALHAYVLGLRHPKTLEPLRWQSNLPLDIRELANCLKKTQSDMYNTGTKK